MNRRSKSRSIVLVQRITDDHVFQNSAASGASSMPPTLLKILAVTDERGLMTENAKDACKGYDYQILEDAGASQDLMTGHELHGMVIDVVAETGLTEAMRARDMLGIKYDLVTHFSFRVRSLAKVLTDMRSVV